MEAGWIRLHRKITEHWIWGDPVKLKLWLDLVMLVNHQPARVNIGLQIFECGRGQTIISLSNLAKRWGVSKDFTRNYLVLLEKDGMISHENLIKTTRITICNYDNYQMELHAGQTHGQTHGQRTPNTRPTQAGRMADTNNNDNNENNDKNDKKIRARERADPDIQRLDIAERRERFKLELSRYLPEYGRETLNDFFGYWTEKTPSGATMRFELQKTWETKRRLASWARNNEKFNSNGTGNSQVGRGAVSPEFRAEILRNIGAI